MRQELPDRSRLSIRNGDDGRDEGEDFVNSVVASGCNRIAGDGPVDRDRDTADAHYREVELVERAAEARAERSGEPGAGPRPAVIRPNPERIRRMRYRRSRMAIAMRRSGPRMTPRTGGDARPRGDDDPCMAFAPTTPRRRLTPKIPERAAQGAAGTLSINDASDVRPKACPGGSEAWFALNGGAGNRRRGTRRRGAAAALERAALRSALRDEVPNEVQAGSAGAPARVP